MIYHDETTPLQRPPINNINTDMAFIYFNLPQNKYYFSKLISTCLIFNLSVYIHDVAYKDIQAETIPGNIILILFAL